MLNTSLLGSAVKWTDAPAAGGGERSGVIVGTYRRGSGTPYLLVRDDATGKLAEVVASGCSVPAAGTKGGKKS